MGNDLGIDCVAQLLTDEKSKKEVISEIESFEYDPNQSADEIMFEYRQRMRKVYERQVSGFESESVTSPSDLSAEATFIELSQSSTAFSEYQSIEAMVEVFQNDTRSKNKFYPTTMSVLSESGDSNFQDTAVDDDDNVSVLEESEVAVDTEVKAIEIKVTELCQTGNEQTPSSRSTYQLQNYPALKGKTSIKLRSKQSLEKLETVSGLKDELNEIEIRMEQQLHELRMLQKENNALRKENALLKAQSPSPKCKSMFSLTFTQQSHSSAHTDLCE